MLNFTVLQTIIVILNNCRRCFAYGELVQRAPRESCRIKRRVAHATRASSLQELEGGGGDGRVLVPGYVSERPIVWALGRVPLDRLHVRVFHQSVELGATVAVCAVAVLCILLTFVLLVFNMYYRKRK